MRIRLIVLIACEIQYNTPRLNRDNDGGSMASNTTITLLMSALPAAILILGCVWHSVREAEKRRATHLIPSGWLERLCQERKIPNLWYLSHHYQIPVFDLPWVKGQIQLKWPDIERLAEVLKMDPDYLIAAHKYS